jgi:RNA polymerase sigma-70 factor (ECF subfamily)
LTARAGLSGAIGPENPRIRSGDSLSAVGTGLAMEAVAMPHDHLGERFEDLYVRHGTAVFARCRRLLDDHAAAEDAAQETFLRVHHHIRSAPAHDPDEALRWMFRIATNYCLNMLRDRRRRPIPTDDLAQLAGRDSGEELMADRDLGRRLTLQAPEHIRAVAWSYHVEGLAQQEIADEFGISRRTVVNYLGAFTTFARKFERSLVRPMAVAPSS